MNFQEFLEGWIAVYAAIVNQDYKGLEKKMQSLSEVEPSIGLSPNELESIDEIKEAINNLGVPLKIEKYRNVIKMDGADVYYSSMIEDELGSCVGYLAGILVSIDPVPDRLLFKGIQEIDLAECLISNKHGSLFLFEHGIGWTSEVETIKSHNNQKVDAWNIDKGMSLMYNEIDYYNFDSLNNSTEKAFLLSLHTKKEVVSFLPLKQTDLSPLLRQLISFFSAPLPSATIIKNILTEKLAVVRLLGVLGLMEQEHPWIEQYNDLRDVVSRLILPEASLYELERLFHSCKKESTVLKETVSLLQSLWSKANETGKMRIMAITDRLLDPILITPGMDIFKDVYKWLCQLEETLNPYKNGDILRCVTDMLDRMRSMKGKLWAIKSEFDNWEDFEVISDEYKTYRTKGLWK